MKPLFDKKLNPCCGFHTEQYYITVFSIAPYLCSISTKEIRLMHRFVKLEEIEEGTYLYFYEDETYLIPFIIKKEVRSLE